MGLTKYLEKKFGSKEKENGNGSYKERYEKAQELKQRQAEYEAEQKGYKKEKIRQASKRGRERAKGSGGGDFFKTIGAIGDFGTGMAKSFGADMFAPPRKPKPKTRKQVVVVKVVGGHGAEKQRRRSTPKRRKHPYEL